MNIKSLAAATSALLVGILIGRILPDGKSDLGESLVSIRGNVTERAARPVKPSKPERIANLRYPTTTPGAPEEDQRMISVPAALLGELSLAAGTRKMDQDLFSRDGKIEEVLLITDHEKALVQTAWRASRQKVREMEAASIKSEEIDEWSVRITVPDLSQSSASIAGDFGSHVRSALGEDRAEAFLAIKQADRILAPPAGERSYTVTSESVGNGRWRYHMTLESPEGRRVWVSETVPDEIRHLTNAAGVADSLGQQAAE